MSDKNLISLEILLLNDLHNTKAIDEDLYNKALKKLTKLCDNITIQNNNTILASA